MEAVAEFFEHEGHLSRDFIHKQLHERGIPMSPDEVQDILELLCRYGLAQKVQLNGTGPWYEHMHIGERHDHLLCTRCGRVVEFDDEELERVAQRLAREHGFEPLFNKCTIYGICPECRGTQGKRIPLTMISPGERVTVAGFNGGMQIRKRLSDMGISIGQEIEVLNRGGPVIVSIKGSRIALGKGLAHKIMVISV
jgi:Fur family ferric uptake transcriptional regulator